MTVPRSLTVVFPIICAACASPSRVHESATDATFARPGTLHAAELEQPRVQETERKHQPWEVTVAGSGANDQDFNAGSAGLNASVGYYFTEIFELVFRQNAAFADAGSGSRDIWNFGSAVALDVHIPLGAVVPFVGVNAGFNYGDTVEESWMAGPEAGVKIYFKSDVFLQVIAQWDFVFDVNNRVGDAFDDGTIFYGLGLGARF